MLLRVLHRYLQYMVLHKVSISSFSKRFRKIWLHCVSFLIFWLKENRLYYLGKGAYEKWTSFVSLGRSLYYQKEYLRKIAKIYEDFFLQLCINDANHSCKQIPHNVATRHGIIQINIFRKNMVAVRGCVTSAAISCT